MKKEIILKGKEFILRPYKKDDFVSLSKNANNKRVAKNMASIFPSPYIIENAKKWIKLNLKNYKKQKYPTSYVIDVNGEAVGTIGGGVHLKRPFIIGLGYWLGEKYWGKGIMSEAIKLYTTYIFKKYKKIIRIQADTFSWNEGSQKVLLKNGFKLEGISKKAYLKDGEIVDIFNFSKLRNER